jgi:3-deoxy-D-manno-octulosonic-acid transferase
MKIKLAWPFLISVSLFATYFVYFLTLVFSALPSFRKSKWALSFRLRQNWKNHLQIHGPQPSPSGNQKTIWIHAASGEIEYAKSVLRDLREKHPSAFFVVTYSSISGLDFQKGLGDADASCPLPFEITGDLREFLDRFSPEILLIARTDVWPLTLNECKKRGIPTLLFAVTQSKPLKNFFKYTLFSALDHISFVSPEDSQNAQLVSPQIQVDGDPRYDQVIWRLSHKKTLLPLKNFLSEPFTLVFGSIWEEDIEALLPRVLDLQASFILVPHEWNLETETLIKTKLQGRSWRKYSELPGDSKGMTPVSVIVVDQKGILAELYEMADAVFVGGSFRRKVHSVMEPLACGKPVLVGPYFRNNREAIEFSSKTLGPVSFVQVVQSAAEFLDGIHKIRKATDLHKEILAEVKTRTGASSRISNRVDAILKESANSLHRTN